MNNINNFKEFVSLNEDVSSLKKKLPDPMELLRRGAEALGIKSFSQNISTLLPEVQKGIKNAMSVATDKGKNPYDAKNFSSALAKEPALIKANEAYVKTLEKLLSDAKKNPTSFSRKENRDSINSLWMLGKAVGESLKAIKSGNPKTPGAAKPAATPGAANPAATKPATPAAKPATPTPNNS